MSFFKRCHTLSAFSERLGSYTENILSPKYTHDGDIHKKSYMTDSSKNIT